MTTKTAKTPSRENLLRDLRRLAEAVEAIDPDNLPHGKQATRAADRVRTAYAQTANSVFALVTWLTTHADGDGQNGQVAPGFDLDLIVDNALAASDDPDPHAVVPAVKHRIPGSEVTSEVSTTLDHLLAYKVTEVVRHRRNGNGGAGRKGGRKRSPGGERREMVRVISNDPKTWRVSLGSRKWKFLADLSVAEVRRVVDGYRTREASNGAEAAKYERLAEEMESAGVDRVGDLADEVLGRIFQ